MNRKVERYRLTVYLFHSAEYLFGTTECISIAAVSLEIEILNEKREQVMTNKLYVHYLIYVMFVMAFLIL